MQAIMYLLMCFVLGFIAYMFFSKSTNAKRKVAFVFQTIILFLLGVAFTSPNAHWGASLLYGGIILTIALLMKVFKFYKDKVFWHLHLCFSVLMISHGCLVRVTNHKAYEMGAKMYAQLQAQVCSGSSLDMSGWISKSSHSYALKFDVLTEPYTLRATVQDDRKTFGLEFFAVMT